MYSINLPVPGAIKRRGANFAPSLVEFETVRERYTLVCKRLPDATAADIDSVESRIRQELRGVQPFEAAVTGLDVFTDPPAGRGPVLFFAVESDRLRAIHNRLCTTFPPVPELEGPEYIPHITLARGGTPSTIAGLVSQSISPIEWTVGELWIWDTRYTERVSSISLPC